jgi:hypothetical protein
LASSHPIKNFQPQPYEGDLAAGAVQDLDTKVWSRDGEDVYFDAPSLTALIRKTYLDHKFWKHKASFNAFTKDLRSWQSKNNLGSNDLCRLIASVEVDRCFVESVTLPAKYLVKCLDEALERESASSMV